MHLSSHTRKEQSPAEKDSSKCQLSFDLRHKLEVYAQYCSLPLLPFLFDNAAWTFSLNKKRNVSIQIQQITMLFSNGAGSFKSFV